MARGRGPEGSLWPPPGQHARPPPLASPGGLSEKVWEPECIGGLLLLLFPSTGLAGSGKKGLRARRRYEECIPTQPLSTFPNEIDKTSESAHTVWQEWCKGQEKNLHSMALQLNAAPSFQSSGCLAKHEMKSEVPGPCEGSCRD